MYSRCCNFALKSISGPTNGVPRPMKQDMQSLRPGGGGGGWGGGAGWGMERARTYVRAWIYPITGA